MGGKLRTNVNYRPHSGLPENLLKLKSFNSNQRKQTTFWHHPPLYRKGFFMTFALFTRLMRFFFVNWLIVLIVLIMLDKTVD